MHGAPFTTAGLVIYLCVITIVGVVGAFVVGRDGKHAKGLFVAVGLAALVIGAGTLDSLGFGAVPLAVISVPINAILMGIPWAITQAIMRRA